MNFFQYKVEHALYSHYFIVYMSFSFISFSHLSTYTVEHYYFIFLHSFLLSFISCSHISSYKEEQTFFHCFTFLCSLHFYFYFLHFSVLDFVQSPLLFKSSSYLKNFFQDFLIKPEHLSVFKPFFVFNCLYLRNHWTNKVYRIVT